MEPPNSPDLINLILYYIDNLLRVSPPLAFFTVTLTNQLIRFDGETKTECIPRIKRKRPKA